MTNKTSKNEFVHLSNARLPEQKKTMLKILEDGVCPFCQENLSKYHNEPIIKKGRFWLITYNQWPYEETKSHFIAISKTHIESFQELDPEAGAELVKLFQEVITDQNISEGGIALRFSSNESASTVKHLHAHLIQPDVMNPTHKGVKFSFSKSRI